MAVRLKVDENLPGDVADVLAGHGHDALTVGDQGWEGTADTELWRRIQAEGRWLVTADKEFGDLRRYPPGSHVGVVLLRLAEESREDYSLLAKLLVCQVNLDENAGAVIVVNRQGVRVRRSP